MLKLINIPLNRTWKKLYQGTRDGFRAIDFHSKCDGYNNTLVLIKSTESYVFGGFTTKLWNDSSFFVYDPDAFLFSLINSYRIPYKFNVKKPEQAIISLPIYGPLFGVNDLKVFSEANKFGSFSRSAIGYSYELPDQYTYFTTVADNLVTGSVYFTATEIEVYTTQG